MSETRLARAFGEAVLRARFRVAPEDFFVEELPAFAPSGEGEHLLLTIGEPLHASDATERAKGCQKLSTARTWKIP